MTKHLIPKLMVSLLLCWQLAHAADDNKVMLNFVNADIESTVKAVGLITGKNFVIDPRVKGTINIVSASPVPKELVYPILLSSLRLQGYSVIETLGANKVIPEADAKQNYSLTVDKNGNVSGDRIVTQVYPLKYESASQLVPVLRPLINPNNSIAVYPGTNTLVITDYADNIRRLNRVVATIDQPSSADIQVIQLKNANASDVAQMIGRMLPEFVVPGLVVSGYTAPEGVRRSQIVPDTKGNALMVRAESAHHLSQVRKLIEQLDQPLADNGNIHVVYLKNAEATKLAATLKSILTGQETSSSPSSAATGTASGNSVPAAAQGSSSSAAGSSGAGAMIQADATTNSLIITAPSPVYRNLQSVIDKLDVRRAQVYVEAMIAEVNVNKVGEFGVQWLVGGGNNNVSGLGAVSLGSGSNNIQSVATSIAAKTPVLPNGFSLGILNGGVGQGKTPNLGLLANAIETNGNGDVLSTPNLLTLDNEEAKIIVGRNVPFVTGTQSSTGSNPNPFTTVERKDVGISLKVKPQVSDGGAITLQVYQEVSDVDTELATGNAGLATTKRSIESKVLVDDGQVIVLGGLIEDRTKQDITKVPLLGDIPWLGNLFRDDDS